MFHLGTPLKILCWWPFVPIQGAPFVLFPLLNVTRYGWMSDWVEPLNCATLRVAILIGSWICCEYSWCAYVSDTGFVTRAILGTPSWSLYRRIVHGDLSPPSLFIFVELFPGLLIQGMIGLCWDKLSFASSIVRGWYTLSQFWWYLWGRRIWWQAGDARYCSKFWLSNDFVGWGYLDIKH